MVKVAFFSNKPYFKKAFEEFNAKGSDIHIEYFSASLNESTVNLVKGYDAICLFVNDVCNAKIIEEISKNGVKLIALRNAGFNNVDLEAAEKFGVTVARVPAYSPHAVAEHSCALILSLCRHVYRAHEKVKHGNFDIDGLLGFDLKGKTVGIIGTGQIGVILCRIMKLGFQCEVIAYDVYQNKEAIEMGVSYVSLDELLSRSDIISLHAPLTPETHHMINEKSIMKMKKGVLLVNTSRGGLIDSKAILVGLKKGQIGLLGLDVYEEESDIFYSDLSDVVIQDDVLTRLTTFPNVLITSHQAWFTKEALTTITNTTLANIRDFTSKGSVDPKNVVKAEKNVKK